MNVHSAATSLPSVEATPLAPRLAAAVVAHQGAALDPAAQEKIKYCLMDFLACAFEAQPLPWASQAAAMATDGAGPCTIIGTQIKAPAGDAAFANSVAGHGLVREDMHTGSVSHLGIVVFPPLMALAQQGKISGVAFMSAVLAGYEVGGKVGRALVTPSFARTFRPTGFTGPFASAVASGVLMKLAAEQISSAISLAANMTGGQNQWPHTGADEMFFEAGLAARNGLLAARLAGAGAYGSEKALDGEAGLFPAYRPDHSTPDIKLFDGVPEIMSVFFKAVPVCNFAQTPCLATLELMKGQKIDPKSIAAIHVHATHAAKAYPGCDYAGPFARVLQAKMSIHFAVASAILRGMVDEDSYKNLNNPDLLALAAKITVDVDADLTAKFPTKQGAEVVITLKDGTTLKQHLPDVLAADYRRVRERFGISATRSVGADKAKALEEGIDKLQSQADVGQLLGLAGA